MAWTWDDIEQEWLAGSRVAAPPSEVVDAFEIVEEMLGRAWLESQRDHGGVRVSGSHPVASVIAMGQRLRAVRHAAGLEPLLKRVRSGDSAAHAELTAAYLCMPTERQVSLEFGVPVQVGGRETVPDFRLRWNGEPWVYVEVTAPDVSELQQKAQALLRRLAAVLPELPLGSTAEVMIRREPTEEEVASILKTLRSHLQDSELARYDLDGVALLLLRHAQPGQIVVDDHGEPYAPRIGVALFEQQGDQGARHIAVRYAFSDQRAEAFLTSEARQLPRDAPALVMVGVSRVPGALRGWEPLLSRRLQPRQHTRVSGITLFIGGMFPLPDGEAWVPHTTHLLNQYAVHPLPAWLTEKLRSWVPPQ